MHSCVFCGTGVLSIIEKPPMLNTNNFRIIVLMDGSVRCAHCEDVSRNALPLLPLAKITAASRTKLRCQVKYL